MLYQFQHHYNLNDVYLECGAYRPKVTSTSIGSTSYASSAALTYSVYNHDDSDSTAEEDTNEVVIDNVLLNLDSTVFTPHQQSTLN